VKPVDDGSAVQVEDIYEAVVRAGLVVVLLLILFCKSDIELAVDNANAKGSIAGGTLGSLNVFTWLNPESYISTVLSCKLVA
jgi:hypothetical protein